MEIDTPPSHIPHRVAGIGPTPEQMQVEGASTVDPSPLEDQDFDSDRDSDAAFDHLLHDPDREADDLFNTIADDYVYIRLVHWVLPLTEGMAKDDYWVTIIIGFVDIKESQ